MNGMIGLRYLQKRGYLWLLSLFRKHWHLSHVALKDHPSSTRKNTEGNGSTHEAPCVHRLFGEVAPEFLRNLPARHGRSDFNERTGNPSSRRETVCFLNGPQSLRISGRSRVSPPRGGRLPPG